MRFLLHILLAILLLTASLGAVCQEAPLSITRANEAYANHLYARAASFYERVTHYRKVPVYVPERLAVCYREINDYADAARWYKVLTDHQPGDAEDWIFYGDALKSMGKYAEAKTAFHHVPDSLASRVTNRIAGCDSALSWIKAPTIYSLSNLAAVNTAGSDWGAVWYSNDIIFTSDSLRLYALDKKSQARVKRHRKAGKLYQKVYEADGDILSGKDDTSARSPLSGFSPSMNDNRFHDGAVVFTPSGDTAWFTVTNQGDLRNPGDVVRYQEGRKKVKLGIRRLELWWTVKDSSGAWGASHAFAYNNSSQYSVGQAALSKDGNTLYFTSDMPGGYGKTDIWFVTRKGSGWSAPVNCGPLVNTEEEEAFPNIGLDGTLYFASKGHIGMGGYDVFKADGQQNVFTAVHNLQYPINSSGDDFYFTPKDSLTGFLSSDRQGGKGGDDIYVYSRPPAFILALPDAPVPTDSTVVFETSNPPDSSVIPDIAMTTVACIPRVPPISILPSHRLRKRIPGASETDTPDETLVARVGPPAPRIRVLRTLVVDWLSGEPLEGAQIAVTTDSDAVPDPILTGADGIYCREIKPNARFIDSATKDGYTGEGRVTGKADAGAPDTISVTLRLRKKPEAGDLFVFHHLYFDFDRSNIRPDAAKELNRLLAYLKQYPTVIIDLSSHTDSRGNDDYNQALSERRAESARKYLMNHGIPLHRIITHGYGESMLVNGCRNGVPCTEVEHQANRRIEIKILRP